MRRFTTHSEEETKAFAEALARRVKPPSVIALYGDLGAGKTVFAKGFACGLGIRERQVKSPTFLMIHSHGNFHHCDLYRIEKLDAFTKEHLQELFLDKKAIVLIEWAERAEKILPKRSIRIMIKVGLNDKRRIIAKNLPDM